MNRQQSGLVNWKAQPFSPIQSVDTHAHIFSGHLPIVPNHRYAPRYDAHLDDYVAALHSNGISHAVLVQPSFLGTNNSHLLDAVCAFPGRLRGVIVIESPMSMDSTTIKILQQMAGKGIAGVRLNLIGIPVPNLATDGWKHLFNIIRMLNWHVELHIEPQRLMPVLNYLLQEKVHCVIDHYARLQDFTSRESQIMAELLKTADSGQVWIKLSASYRIAEQTKALEVCGNLANTFLQKFSCERLLWGSDWPHTQYENVGSLCHEKTLLDNIITKDTDRRAILATTPAQLYGWSMNGS